MKVLSDDGHEARRCTSGIRRFLATSPIVHVEGHAHRCAVIERDPLERDEPDLLVEPQRVIVSIDLDAAYPPSSGLFGDVSDECSTDALAHEGGIHKQVLELQPASRVRERGEADDVPVDRGGPSSAIAHSVC